MKKDLISVIVPCYNVSQWLEDCFKSLENQTYENLEIIFVNDGSKDDTLEKLEAFCKGKNNCKLIDQTNRGLSGARNSGVAIAEGEWLYFLDADDILEPVALERLYDVATKHNVCCSMCKFKDIPEDFHYKDMDVYAAKDCEVEEISGTAKILKTYINYKKIGHSACTRLYNHEKLKQMKNYPHIFDENIKFCEDVDFCFRFFAGVDKVAFSHERLYLYRQRNQSLMHETFSVKKLDALKSYDHAIELCNEAGHLKSVKHTAVLRKFDRCLMLLNNLLKDKFQDKEIIKKLTGELKKTIIMSHHPVLFVVYFYYVLRLRPLLAKK